MTPPTHHQVEPRLASEIALVTAGAVLTVVGTFLPWLRSGEVWRNSYEVWRSADRLGVVEGTAAGVVQALWFLLPAAVGGLVLAVALSRDRLAAAIAVLVVALPTVGALLAERSPLPVGMGVWVTLLGALVTVAGVVLVGREHRRRARAASRL